MRSSNPVFTRTDFGADQRGYGYDTEPRLADYESMTLQDVVNKSFILLILLVGVAIATITIVPVQALSGVAVLCSVAALVAALVVSFRRKVSAAGVVVYTVLEGAVIGAWSYILESMYPGIVFQAVLGTFMAAAATFVAYRFGGVRVRGKFARGVVIGMFAYVGVALVNLVFSFFGNSFGWAGVGAGAGAIAWVSAGIGVFLAVASLVMDFDEIERGVRMGAPRQESWRAAFGLMVTMIWLYTQILRILSFFRND
ncbi:hypothetical protein HMPREF9306_00689 [Propionimicrobium lymphophilum ACS-093-V-SCH5]|uniref:Bax inhibitor-1/YccA family protein n=1 Tax=Propionimicrobium lymphophilum ACS-093-V-SCH5 TaxID=883161 RepID=S2W084_9ACTN|nr:Bax inhibitor-1/YccA family protein [Propionimicrobium lymphophilum]EPD33158.1 hypothetical protein HMPREF9306_00689 [Propionimicrobium lymphophilum ACS-093-V-SCH5]